ncbi:NAD+ synthase [Desulfonatronovibrio magnus]|uniref:NAD+ synthase n=1 Tax=Desulfonatronovibrio magnus TaxID=698827 RepID=UPI0005EADEB0|nr:NAD+ synthase [Desulfonatronovibrio magnus]
MRVALLQINPTICDLQNNALLILKAASRAFALKADMCITPELAITGYPPRDLLFRSDLIDESHQALKWLASKLHDCPPVLVGTPWRHHKKEALLNGACLLWQGKIAGFFGKSLLPNYDVFDEQRYFLPSEHPGSFDYHGLKIGVTICEDIWNDDDFWENKRYRTNPVQHLSDQGADIIVNLSASPFSLGKQALRKGMLSSLAVKYRLPFLFCNQAGCNDDLVFDGRSMAVDHNGRMIAAAKEFDEDLLIVDLNNYDSNRVQHHDFTKESEAWQAVVAGIRDYTCKNNFAGIVLGLSGGIDSALAAVAAARAIGPDKVTGVMMPSPYSSTGSVEDSIELARNIGIKTLEIPISNLMQSFDHALAPVFHSLEPDITEENIQSRIRGNLLMAISNKMGWLVLATGNKSELAVGYCTIYGDMSGGLAPLADIPKTLVYSIARWINSHEQNIIPEQIITKPPSAELKPDQTDQDSLPDYETLDQILHLHVQCNFHLEQIIARGYSPAVVKKVINMVRKAEFKRRQSPPGLKITDRAFGTGWRMPVTASCTKVTKM